jgi:hypothetical protein
MNWLGHQDSEMVKHYYHLHDDEARRQMDRLDPLGNAGKQHAGVNRAAQNQKEPTSRDNNPKIAT